MVRLGKVSRPRFFVNFEIMLRLGKTFHDFDLEDEVKGLGNDNIMFLLCFIIRETALYRAM